MFVGGLYTAFVPRVPAAADDQPALSEDAQKGKQLYETTCITCHGRNAQGVPDRGPSLIGVGSAAVEFQVNTGRMPAARQRSIDIGLERHDGTTPVAAIGSNDTDRAAVVDTILDRLREAPMRYAYNAETEDHQYCYD